MISERNILLEKENTFLRNEITILKKEKEDLEEKLLHENNLNKLGVIGIEKEFFSGIFKIKKEIKL